MPQQLYRFSIALVIILLHGIVAHALSAFDTSVVRPRQYVTVAGKKMSYTAGVGYDQNGDGESEEDSTIVTDDDIVRRLHLFLEMVHIAPPYLLVGHSMGGPLAVYSGFCFDIEFTLGSSK